jgi:O-antigen ligase
LRREEKRKFKKHYKADKKMTRFKWLQIAFLVLLPLSLTFVYLNSGNFFLGAIMGACLISGCFCSIVLDKPELGILSILVALAFTDRQLDYMFFSFQLIYLSVAICFTHYFLSHLTTRKYFWFFALFISSYHIFIIIAAPYPVLRPWTLNCITQLGIFLWCILIKWNVKKIMNIAIPYSVYLLAYGFIEKLVIDPTRIGGPTTYATNFAILLTFLWAMWFIEAYLSKRHHLYILATVSFLVLIAVLLSGTRNGFLGLLIGLFGALGARVWIGNLHKSVAKKLIYLGSIFLLIMGSIVLLWRFLPQDMFIIKTWNILLSGNLDSSSIGRVTTWATAIDAFLKNPVWGIGPGNFLIAHSEFLAKIPNLPPSIIPLGHAHSIALNVLAENGIVGFGMLFVVMSVCYFQLARFLIRNPENSMGYMLLFGGVIIFCLPMVDMIPSPGWDSWYYGILASLGFHKYVAFSEPENKFNIKTISEHSKK